MVVLDLNTNDIRDNIDRQVLCGMERFDQQLCRIASQSIDGGSGSLTVKLSAFDPYPLGRRLYRFRRLGRLVVGTRYKDASLCICQELHWFGDY